VKRRGREKFPELDVLTRRPFLGYALAKSGKEAEARSVLEGLLEQDEALAWLERAYAQRGAGMVFLKVE